MPRNQPYNEDLFEDTKMTFGEHLEELRKCLVKALLGLAIGMGIGLYFSSWLVRQMQGPLSSALSTYYRDQGLERVRDQAYGLVDLDSKGNLPPDVEGRLLSGKFLLDIIYESPPPSATPPAETPSATPQTEDERKAAEAAAEKQRLAAVDQYADKPFTDLTHRLVWRRVEDDPRVSIKSLSVQENFMIWIKGGFLFGALLSSPWVLWQVWTFIAAGLYPHERSYVYKYLPFSLVLFLVGAALAFFFVFGFVLEFLFKFNREMGIDPDPRISEWLSFAILMPVCFGVSFQLPLVMLFLARIGVMSAELYLAKWRIAVLVIALLAMVFSPGGDPISMLSLFIPLTGLYFLGIWLCRTGKREVPAVEAV